MTKSPPSWRRGLKLLSEMVLLVALLVASLVEAWIETDAYAIAHADQFGRLPRGGVD